MSLLIKNGRVVTTDRDEVCDVFMERDTVTAVGPNLSQPADTILDATGKYVIPGGIDVHTHLEAPVGGTFSSDDFETGTRAAAFGGTTTIIDFATQSRGGSMLDAYDQWRSKARKSVIDYGLHMVIVDLPKSRLSEIDRMIANGVTSFKVFMAYTKSLMLDDASIYSALLRAGSQGGLVCVHAENGSVIDILIEEALSEKKTAPIYHAYTRPAATEAEAVNRAIYLAKIADAPVYFVHVSCKESLREIKHARRMGMRVVGESCPHYLLLTDRELKRPDFEGAKYVLTPPLRTTDDHEPLWRALRDGDLQVISTDHCPFNFESQKKAGLADFTKIPNGGPGIEHRLQLTHHFGVNNGLFSLQRWVQLCSAEPAQLFGLFPRKGTIAPGSDADIVLWDPNQEIILSASTHHMQVDYSMYEGYRLRGTAATVISRGEIVVDSGQWHGASGRGQYIPRGTFSTAWKPVEASPKHRSNE